MNVDVLWNKILKQLETELNSISYKTWFSETSLYKLDKNIAYIIVPMQVTKRHLKDNYYDLIINKLKDETNNYYDLEFFLSSEIEELTKKENDNEIIDIIENTEVSTVDKNYSYESTNLKKEFNFDTFIVGNSNKFAQAAALSVAENPGIMYNPLFIYGNSGLGKTHLMHAIGNYIFDNSDKRVLYVKSDTFISDFINITKKSENEDNYEKVDFFKDKYRNVDVLLIDDIQSFNSATSSRNEFFHTFNDLRESNKQIIITSDRSPNDLNKFEERLKTRFSWGLTVNIFPPDVDLKREILRKKITAYDLEQDIPEDVIEYIASNIGPDVRQLEGAINRLMAYSAMFGGCDINLSLAIDVLKDNINKGMGEKNDIQRIQRIVSEHFQISVEDIRSKKRSSNISFPRQVAMYLCRNLTNESFPRIGIEFGGKDHSTVMHSVEKIENEIKVNKDLENTIEKIKNDIINI